MEAETKQAVSRKIVVPIGAAKAICEVMDVSDRTVYSALHYKTNSWLAVQIRELAVKKYHGEIINQNSK